MNIFDFFAVSSSSYLLVFAAEIGDKSQLVCIVLAARYKSMSVIWGSILAFVVLNSLAVTFGVAISQWIPAVAISAIVAMMFAVFGVLALKVEETHEDEKIVIKSKRSIMLATFLLITVAEFGDKTQLAVVALSSTSIPIAVWLGATYALITTSILAVWAGQSVLKKFPITLLHRISGIIFMILAIVASYKTYTLL